MRMVLLQMENKKREKFEELAEKRVNEIIKKIRLVGNLSNRNNYDYTDNHVKQIISNIKNEVADLEEKFNSKKKEQETTFKFKK